VGTQGRCSRLIDDDAMEGVEWGRDEVAGAEGGSQPQGARLRFPMFIITVLVSLSSVTT
jgi:hypothetical protein